jgi:hypothetical protein
VKVEKECWKRLLLGCLTGSAGKRQLARGRVGPLQAAQLGKHSKIGEFVLFLFRRVFLKNFVQFLSLFKFEPMG